MKVSRRKKSDVTRRKKSAVKKTSKPKSSEASSLMAPGRVMALDPGSLKRMLDEPVPTRVSRSKGIDVTNHEDSRLPMGEESTTMLDEQPFPRVTRSKSIDVTNHEESWLSIDEESTMHMDLSPVAPTRASNQPLDSDVFVEPADQQQQHDDDHEGKFI